VAEAKPKAGGGLLKKLSPKQKRYAAVIGGGALLALVYLIMRNRSGPVEGSTPASTEGAVESAPIPGGGGGATDPSAFLGAQGESITERLGEVGAGLSEVGAGLGQVSGGQDSLREGLGTMGEAASDFQSSEEQANARTAEALNKQNRQLKHITEKLKGNGSSKGGSKGTGGGAAPKNNPPPKGNKNPPKNPPPKPAPKPSIGPARTLAPAKKKR
jgi:hypothetical protein